MNIKTFKSLMLLVFGVLLLGQIQEDFPQKAPLEPIYSGSSPTLNTEKSVYQFGETVKISGINFMPFETVGLTVRRTDATAITFIGENIAAEWLVIANEKGTIESSWVVNYPGSRFSVEALSAASKSSATVEFIIFSHTANLDQCRNGTQDIPNDCTGTNWVNGDLNGSQAHYIEGESVPYRLILSNLALGVHNVTIEYDSTEGGKHSIDYLTAHNKTEPTSNPCSGIAGCDPATFGTGTIPANMDVAKGPDGVLGTADDIVQIPGVFTLYGGTITTVSGYTMTGTFGGSSKTRLTINFAATATTTVLAWGGHIATRQDWGTNNSAIAISGAPYHMRVFDVDGEGGGNQDRSMQSGAVYYPGSITIIKDAQPDSIVPFVFSATGSVVADFTIDDDGDNTNTYSNAQTFANLTNFGAGHSVTVVEASAGGVWALTQISCVSAPNGGTGTDNNVVSLPARQVEIFLEEGEFVTCTFVNSVITAAAVSIGGEVRGSNGHAIRGVHVTLVSTSTGDEMFARTNPFGYYMFEGLSAGETYVISVAAKGYTFKVPSLLITPMENTRNVNFEGIPMN